MSLQVLENYADVSEALPQASERFIQDYLALKQDACSSSGGGGDVAEDSERLGGELPDYYATKTEVDTAQSTANDAQIAADDAQATADEAQATADTSQVTADEAKVLADEAALLALGVR